jgi:hypothetical protein
MRKWIKDRFYGWLDNFLYDWGWRLIGWIPVAFYWALTVSGKIDWRWWVNAILLVIAIIITVIGILRTRHPKEKTTQPAVPSVQAVRRFGVRCGTDLYSPNMLTGDIPGRYLHAEITASPSVGACKAYLREIRGGNRHWEGQEQLTFEPSESPDSLSKLIIEKIKYRLDVLLLVSNGDIVVCNHNHVWARWPSLNDIFAARGPYDLTIDIGGENAAGETFSLEPPIPPIGPRP